MATKVNITVISEITDSDGEVATSNLFVLGTLVTDGNVKNRSYKLCYSEVIAESSTDVEITVDAKRVSIMRFGEMSLQLTLEEGKSTYGRYDFAEGSFDTHTNTELIEYELNKYGGKLHFIYNVDVNGGFAGRNEISIFILPLLFYR
ncbi:MAG: DUF1934 domain-containing protein [Oscillospiraceae bacterium]|jgi:uncharacterized beta-barrel protein YwiB (DUF1934 family)|nr:DUF1934 domain-containing protein [Oscillospiraceae bacterium]